MKATELRIGNYVYFKNSETELFTNDLPIEDIDDLKNIYDGQEVKPISLTEEWLIHLGFKNYSPNYWSDKDKNFRFALLPDGLHCSISGNNSEQGILFKRINYVHELQNLYFALTGKELI